MASEAFNDLVMVTTKLPKYDGQLYTLIGEAHIKLPAESGDKELDAIDPVELPDEAAHALAIAGWTHLQLRTDVRFFDPRLTAEVIKEDETKLGHFLRHLAPPIGIRTGLLAAKRIGLKTVSNEIDTAYLPEDVLGPKQAFITVEKTDNGPEIVRCTEQLRYEGNSSEWSSSSPVDFFDINNHVYMGRPIDRESVAQAEPLFTDLHSRFARASRALVAAAVGEQFSVTQPTLNQLWTPTTS